MVKDKCILCGREKEFGVSLHRFPADPELRSKWQDFIGSRRLTNARRLCSLHFAPEYISSGGWSSIARLDKKAVPTENHPLAIRPQPAEVPAQAEIDSLARIAMRQVINPCGSGVRRFGWDRDLAKKCAFFKSRYNILRTKLSAKLLALRRLKRQNQALANRVAKLQAQLLQYRKSEGEDQRLNQRLDSAEDTVHTKLTKKKLRKDGQKKRRIEDKKQLHKEDEKELRTEAGAHVPLFEDGHILEFLMRAPDQKYLVHKVLLILGVSGGGMLEYELQNLRHSDVHDRRDHIAVDVVVDGRVVREFTVPNKKHYCSYIRKYLALRPSNASRESLFLRYSDGQCVDKAIEIKVFRTAWLKVAEFLRLGDPARYTFQSLVRPKEANADQPIFIKAGGSAEAAELVINGSAVCSTDEENRIDFKSSFTRHEGMDAVHHQIVKEESAWDEEEQCEEVSKVDVYDDEPVSRSISVPSVHSAASGHASKWLKLVSGDPLIKEEEEDYVSGRSCAPAYADWEPNTKREQSIHNE